MTLSEVIPNPKFRNEKWVDQRAETLIAEFTLEKYGTLSFPVPTDALLCLVERDASDFDPYADLSDRDGNPEGVTDFIKGKRPFVAVAAHLHEGSSEHRLRSTLAHEYGHIVLHDPIVQDMWAQGKLIENVERITHSSYRPRKSAKRQGDFVEYQAWYFCRALLMPFGPLTQMVNRAMEKVESFVPQHPESDFGLKAVGAVVRRFGVSPKIAEIRLLDLGLLSEETPEPSLF